MCGAAVTTFTDCQHSKVTYIYCDSCPLEKSPPKTRGVYKQILFMDNPDLWDYLKKGKYKDLYKNIDRRDYHNVWKPYYERQYKRAIESRDKMMECPNWPKEFRQRGYGTIIVDGKGKCLEEGGACDRRRPEMINEFDKDGVFLRRKSALDELEDDNVRVWGWIWGKVRGL